LECGNLVPKTGYLVLHCGVFVPFMLECRLGLLAPHTLLFRPSSPHRLGGHLVAICRLRRELSFERFQTRQKVVATRGAAARVFSLRRVLLLLRQWLLTRLIRARRRKRRREAATSAPADCALCERIAAS
jgi:hypothetical protein